MRLEFISKGKVTGSIEPKGNILRYSGSGSAFKDFVVVDERGNAVSKGEPDRYLRLASEQLGNAYLETRLVNTVSKNEDRLLLVEE